jgi:hypothetical protein
VTTYLRCLTVATCLAVVAVTLVASSASGAGRVTAAPAAKCKEGVVQVNGRSWVQYCGPATATVRFSGRTVKFASGRCQTRKPSGVLILYIGKRPLRGTSPKTKYWEHVSHPNGDGVQRKDVFVEWWLGKKHYVLGNIKMTFKNKQKQATYTGQLLSGGKGTASGSFRCSAPSA